MNEGEFANKINKWNQLLSLQNKTIALLYAWIFFISSVFYFITGLVYGLLWETHNIHGWTVFGLVVSRFFLCVFLGLANAFDVNEYQIQKTFTCKAVGEILQNNMYDLFGLLI